MPFVLRIQLLGGFNLVYNDTPMIGLNSARLQTLLAYLILHADTPQLRHHVAFSLWPNTSESQARNNLRQFFYQLRHALPNPDHFLEADANTICWKTSEDQLIDVQRFEHTLKGAEAVEQQGDTRTLRQLLEHACSYYQGDLLPGCYDDWLTPERERLQQRYYHACQKLVGILETQQEYMAALQVAQHLLRLDPLDEAIYELLMRLYGLTDNRIGIQRTYQTAVKPLWRELGVEPGEALQAAHKRLQDAPRKNSSFNDGVATSAYKLVGRRIEWQQIQTVWQRAAGARLIFC